jgi:hypothetical protein
MPAMMLTRLALLVAAYLSLDVANPLMPGALTFGVEDSVEARQSDRLRGQGEPLAPVPRAPEPGGLDRSAEALTRRPLARTMRPASRPTPVTRSRLSSPAPPSPAEDH